MGRFRVKLLYISRDHTSHDHRFTGALAEAGFDVHALCLTGAVWDRRSIPAGVTRLDWVGHRRLFETPEDWAVRWLALKEIVASLKPDIALAGPIQTATLLLASTGFSPYVAMSWGSDLLVDAARDEGMASMTQFALGQAAGFLGDCKAVKDVAQRYLRCPDDRIAIFPWGIDTEAFSPSGPSPLEGEGWGEGSRGCSDTGRVHPFRATQGWKNNPVMISIRSWVPSYKVDMLVHAFEQVLKQHPDARLVLAGDGPESGRIEKLIRELGLHDKVITPGRLDNDQLADWLRACDLYVSTVPSDGSSISLLEAMGCGLPVIASEGFGNVEWVEPGKTGWLVPPGNAEVLACTLSIALSDRTRLRRMGEEGRREVVERAEWSRNFTQLPALLRAVVGAT